MSWIAELFAEFLIEPVLYILVFILKVIGFLPVFWFVKIFDNSKSISQIWKEYNNTSACLGLFMLICSSVFYLNYLG